MQDPNFNNQVPPQGPQGPQYPQGPQGPQYPQYPQGPQAPQPGKGLAIASLVLGIIAVVFWWLRATVVLGIIGVVCGIVGIILGVMAKKQGNTSGIATAGLVLSIIATALCAIFTIACIACVSSVAGGLSSLY